MLFDEREVEIMATTHMPGHRKPDHAMPSIEIFVNDFLDGIDMSGKTLLDMGPGQWGFAEIAKQRGATVHGFDYDMPIVELGRYRGYEAVYGRLEDYKASDMPAQYDGIFSRGTLNPYFFIDNSKGLMLHAGEIAKSLKPGAWCLIMPYLQIDPNLATLPSGYLERPLLEMVEVFSWVGFDILVMPKAQREYLRLPMASQSILMALNLEIPQVWVERGVKVNPGPDDPISSVWIEEALSEIRESQERNSALFEEEQTVFDAGLQNGSSANRTADIKKLPVNLPEVRSEPGVCLTLDDQWIDAWYGARQVFENHRTKATFFVSSFQNLGADAIAKLKELSDQGHEIGCHSANHVKAEDFLAGGTIDEYLRQEVYPAMGAMISAGFIPSAYCYPFSNSTPELDAALLKHFEILRSGARPFEDCLAEPAGNCFAFATNVDIRGHEKTTRLPILLRNLERVASAPEPRVAVLYAHGIGGPTELHNIAPDALEILLMKIEELGLRYYTISELARPKAAASAAP